MGLEFQQFDLSCQYKAADAVAFVAYFLKLKHWTTRNKACTDLTLASGQPWQEGRNSALCQLAESGQQGHLTASAFISFQAGRPESYVMLALGQEEAEQMRGMMERAGWEVAADMQPESLGLHIDSLKDTGFMRDIVAAELPRGISRLILDNVEGVHPFNEGKGGLTVQGQKIGKNKLTPQARQRATEARRKTIAAWTDEQKKEVAANMKKGRAAGEIARRKTIENWTEEQKKEAAANSSKVRHV